MRSLKLRCPNPKCRVNLKIPHHMRSQKVRCPICGQSVPTTSAASRRA